MTIVKHRLPSFVQHDPAQLEQKDITTLEELHKLEFVKRWTSSSDFVELRYAPFYSEPPSPTHRLMAILQDHTFWVIGYIYDAETFGLAEFTDDDMDALQTARKQLE